MGATIGAVGGAVSAAINGGSLEEIGASALGGAAVGGVAALTGGTSLLATVGTGAIAGGVSDAIGQTVVNFDSDNIDTSSLEAGIESAAGEFVDAVSDIDGSSVASSTILGGMGGTVSQLGKAMKFSDTAVDIATETNNTIQSLHKEGIKQAVEETFN